MTDENKEQIIKIVLDLAELCANNNSLELNLESLKMPFDGKVLTAKLNFSFDLVEREG